MKMRHSFFTQAIEAEPDNAIGYVNFGNLLAVLEDTERAERFFPKGYYGG